MIYIIYVIYIYKTCISCEAYLETTSRNMGVHIVQRKPGTWISLPCSGDLKSLKKCWDVS